MTSVTTDQRLGVNADQAVKVPCAAASTSNLTLSGEQTVDGVALVTGDRCLATGQTTGSENGIWVVDTGAWTRPPDWDGANDVVYGTIIFITGGTNNLGYWQVSTSGTITPDTTSVALSQTVPGAYSSTLLTYDTIAAETAASVTPVNLYYEPYNVLRYGAAADSGTTNNLTAFQNAIDACNAGGGGVVKVPKPATDGAYYSLGAMAGDYLILKDNVILEGEGYASYMRFEYGGLLTGTYQGSGGGNDIFAETEFEIADASAGAYTITWVDDPSLTAGDLICICDNRAPTGVLASEPYQQFITEVVSVGASTFNTKHALPEAYAANGVGTEPTVRKLNTGSVTGFGGGGAFVGIRNGVKNMRMSTINENNWQVIHFGSYESVFENIWIQAKGAGFSGNPLVRSRMTNMWIEFEWIGSEQDYACHNNLWNNIWLTRTGERAAQSFQFTFSETRQGCADNTYNNIHFESWRAAAQTYADVSLAGRRCKMQNFSITYDTIGAYTVIGIGQGSIANAHSSNVLTNGHINGEIDHIGLSIAGEFNKVNDITIDNTASTTQAVVKIFGDYNEVTGVQCGDEVNRTIYDIIEDAGTGNTIRNNRTFYTHRPVYTPQFTTYTDLTETTAESYAISADTWALNQGFHIKASGNVSGTNDAKTIKLKIDDGVTPVTLQTISWAAGDTGYWSMDCVVLRRSGGNTLYSASGYSDKAGTFSTINSDPSGPDKTNAITIDLTVDVDNASDSIKVRYWSVEPINSQ